MQWKVEESCGKVSIRGHGSELERIIMSASSESQQHSENFIGFANHHPDQQNDMIHFIIFVLYFNDL